MYNIMISAGESSGDAHGASALAALRELGVEFNSFGMGADKLHDSGTDLIVDCRDLSVMGFVDVLLNLPAFYLRARKLKQAMRARKPDLLIVIDYANFNLSLAETARSLDIPVLFYISPKVWASRPERIHKIGQRVSHMAVLFPFEVPLYEEIGVPVTYVGNPLLEQIDLPESSLLSREKLGLAQDNSIVGLMPGSRKSEIKYILPLLLEAANLLHTRSPNVKFILPKANTINYEQLSLWTKQYSHLPINIVDGDAHSVMHASDALMIASGTATLEAAIIGTPMVVVYKMHWLNFAIIKRILTIKDVSLVNIVAGKRIVPELLQAEASAENLCAETLTLLNDREAHALMSGDLNTVRETMGEPGASQKLAGIALNLLQTSKS